MNFDLDADDLALQSGIRELCAGRFPIERLRALVSPGGVDRDDWRALGGAGVFNLRRPESEGGIGMGMAAATVVFEELGRALVPGPLVSSHITAGLVEGAAEGATMVGIVPAYGPAVVEHFEALDVLLHLGKDGVMLSQRSEVEATPVPRPLDPLVPLAVVDEGLTRSLRVGDAAEAARLQQEGAVLVAAQLVGIAAAVTDLAVAYAKTREQFGRPIGAFQAVKHLCADMLVATEVARAAVYAAGATIDQPEVGDVARAIHGAKLLASEAALRNAKGCIQVHGGMGFTWEIDAHLYLKRAVVLATQFGGADAHADALAAAW